MDEPNALRGRRIVVPESRELDLFARMLEAQGAETLRCPMVTILDAEDPAPVEAWLKRFAAGKIDDLVLLTGEGLRRLLALARRVGIEGDVVSAVKRVRTVTRGPKPARVLRELGLQPSLAAEEPTTAGVIAILSRETLTGRSVGVQLYPGNPNDLLLNFLRGAGASPDAVLPYRYASDAETARVEDTIRAMADGKVDAIAFTSSPQVERLSAVAKERGLEKDLARGLASTRIAAVGPVVAAAIEALGAKVAVMPQSSFHMKPLVTAISAALREN
jgi:uroporphyrinogen-III synthase